jgi:HlyD family secretion protein
MAEERKRWVGLVLGAAVVVLVVIGLASREQAPAVETAKATRETLSSTITSNGKVEPIEPHIMRAGLATFVEKVMAVEGQTVRRGQHILTLNTADARAQLAQARSDLLTAQDQGRAARAGGPADDLAQIEGDLRKAQLNVASLERTQQSLEQLVAKQAATPNELEQNRIALERARSELKALQEKHEALGQRAGLDVQRSGLRVQQVSDLIRALEEKVRSGEVVSPVDGTLYSLPVRGGAYVQVGDVLAEMADLHRVRVRAFVDEPDIGWLEPQQPVEVTWDAMPTQVWTGQTEQVPKEVVARQTRSVGEVLCSVDNSKLELLPNVNVEVRIRVRDRQGALAVPRAAVRADGSHHFVFLVQGEHLRRQEIQVGIFSATRYEVLAGLNEGDRVALPADVELRDGMEVRVADAR